MGVLSVCNKSIFQALIIIKSVDAPEKRNCENSLDISPGQATVLLASMSPSSLTLRSAWPKYQQRPDWEGKLFPEKPIKNLHH